MLEYARYGDSGDPLQKLKGECRRLPVGFYFIKTLENEGVNVTVRRKLGGDVDASCGQLRRKMQKADKTR